jgi:transcriptional regulator with XRE-family HTH domain
MAGNGWQAELREARQALGLSQRALAAAAGVAAQTVKSYELGLRRPSRELLSAILTALKLERTKRNRILMAAGFAPDGLALRPQNADLMFSEQEAAQEAERQRWPAFVLNEVMEVVCANRVAQQLWGVNLGGEFPNSLDRNLLGVASNPRFADRCVNWDEAIGVMISVFKGHHRGAEDLDQPSPYFQTVLQQFLAGDPKYVRRFLSLWETVQPAHAKIRWSYPVVWEEPGIGRMRFHCIASSANEADGLSFNDWIPLDAESWAALEALRRGRHR